MIAYLRELNEPPYYCLENATGNSNSGEKLTVRSRHLRRHQSETKYVRAACVPAACLAENALTVS